MSARPLKSDQVNYLVWRYLQESGHAQTAARLQRDWGRGDPEKLPYSQYIRTHALVHLLQKGLRYHELETALDQYGNRIDPSAFFFGPEAAASPPLKDADIEDDASTGSRKHAREQHLVVGSLDAVSHLPAPKRTRRNNGSAVNGRSSSRSNNKNGDGMDLDQPGVPEPPTKREPATTNSPPATANTTAAVLDTDMDVDATEQERSSGAADASAAAAIANATAANADADAIASNANAASTSASASGRASVSASAHAEAEAEADADGDAEDDPAAAGAQHPPLPPPPPPPTATNGLDEARATQFQAQVEQQHAPLIPTLTHGCSVGVQSDKVTDLGPETAVLSVPGKNVTHALWSPRDPSLLAAGGDALCRIWSVPSTSALARSGRGGSRGIPNGVSPPSGNANSSGDGDGGPGSGDGLAVNGVDASAASAHASLHPSDAVDLHDTSEDFIVTSMAWSPDGELIAVAKHPKMAGKRGSMAVYTKTGTILEDLPGGQDWVLSLLWSTNGSLLLGISHSDGNSSTLMAWDMKQARAISPSHVSTCILDAVWVDDRSFVVCANGMVAASTVSDHIIEPLQARQDLGSPQEWSRVRHEHIFRTTVVASEATGTLGLFDGYEAHSFHTTQAHSAEITALMFQPIPNPSALTATSPRLVATAATDGVVKLWDSRKQLELVHTLEMGKVSPALALSFTPDGYLVAAASWDKVLFWNPDVGGPPKAMWNAQAADFLLNGDAGHVNGNGNGNAIGNGNGISAAEDGDVSMTDEDADPTLSLSWDADGGKLAYGSKSKIAIISFRR